MACLVSEEIEDLVTCSICCCEYDDDLRKPKFLDCFHTFCAECLKSVHAASIHCIPCPLCRIPTYKRLDVMKTNVYALHMSKMRQDADKQTRTIMWCFTCSSLLNAQCSAMHYSIAIPSKNICDGQELQRKLDQCQCDLFISIQERLDVQKELRNLLHSLKKVENNIRGQLEQNDEQLDRQTSIHLDLQRTGESTENFELLQRKIVQIAKDMKVEIEKLRSRLDEQGRQKETRLKIQFENVQKTKLSGCRLFENGFCRADNAVQVDEELHVLTHLTLSVNEKMKMSEKQNTTSTTLSSHPPLPLNMQISGSSLSSAPACSALTLTLMRSTSRLGEIRIKLSDEFKSTAAPVLEYYRNLGPQTCESKISKAAPNKYVILQFAFEAIHPTLPSCWSKRKPSSPNEVGVILKSGTVKELLFILKSNAPRSGRAECSFIGTLTDALDLNCLKMFSLTPKSDRLPMTIHWAIS